MQGSFCGAVLGQSAQILSGQRLPISLSNAVDRGSPVLHMREFLRSGPWAVSSNSPHKGGSPEKGVGSASPGFAHILPRTASLIPMSCHMREINLTNHSLSSHSPPNQTPCYPSNFFPRTLFKKVCILLYLLSPAQSIEQWCHCYFSVHNSTCPSHPYPQKKI